MKRFIALFLSLLLCISALPTFATVDAYYDNQKLTLSGALTYYPALELLSALGATIETDGNDFTAQFNDMVIRYDGYYEELYVNDSYYYEGEDYQTINGELYLPMAFLKNIMPVDYSESQALHILSPEALAQQQARQEKKFNTIYPMLSTAFKTLPNTSFEQALVMKLEVTDLQTEDAYDKEEFESLEEKPQIKMTTVMAQDANKKAYKYHVTLETNEYGDRDIEEHEMIMLKDALFIKKGASWYQETVDEFADFKLDMNIQPFFLAHTNDIKEERVNGGKSYTIEMKEAPLSVLLDAMGDQYAEAMEIDDIEDDYTATFKDLKWTVTVDYKNQLKSNTMTGSLSLYDSWSDSTMILSVDLEANYDMSKEIHIESPLENYTPQIPLDLSTLKVSLDDKHFTSAIDIRLVDQNLLVKSTDLTKLFDVTVVEDYYTVALTSKDQTLVFEFDSDEIMVGDTKFSSTAETTYIGESFYVPLKSAIEFSGGLCLIDRANNKVSIYSPDYLESKYFTKTMPATDTLADAIAMLNASTYKTTKDIRFKVDNYVNYSGSYDDYDLSYMNTAIVETEYVDPVNKYLNSTRDIKVLSDYEDAYLMQLVSSDNDLYYTFVYGDESPYWYMDEDVVYERLVHDETVKLNKLRTLLKPVAGEKNTFAFKQGDKQLTNQEQITLGRMVYDGFVLDNLYTFPIDSIQLENFEISYTLDDTDRIQSQLESYLFRYDDGMRTFDITLITQITYDAFGMPVEKFIPEMSQE